MSTAMVPLMIIRMVRDTDSARPYSSALLKTTVQSDNERSGRNGIDIGPRVYPTCVVGGRRAQKPVPAQVLRLDSSRSTERPGPPRMKPGGCYICATAVRESSLIGEKES